MIVKLLHLVYGNNLSGYGELHIESGNFVYQYPIITNYNGTLQSLTNGNTNSVLEIHNSCDSSTILVRKFRLLI